MHGRMIHGKVNDRLVKESQLYDVHGRVSYIILFKAAKF